VRRLILSRLFLPPLSDYRRAFLEDQDLKA
jgi:hypothetical protein